MSFISTLLDHLNIINFISIFEGILKTPNIHSIEYRIEQKSPNLDMPLFSTILRTSYNTTNVNDIIHRIEIILMRLVHFLIRLWLSFTIMFDIFHHYYNILRFESHLLTHTLLELIYIHLHICHPYLGYFGLSIIFIKVFA
jgi:hypothetical protein